MRRPLLPATLAAATTLAVVVAGAAGGTTHDSRLYAASSPWNTPIAANAAVDPRSDAYVAELVRAAGAKGFVFSRRNWTTPVFYAARRTPTITVRLTASWARARFLSGVPMPANAQPDPASDGHLMVVDRSRGCEYDFWQARREPGGAWAASWGNAISIRGSGIYRAGGAARASGFALGAGLVLPSELGAGSIAHALAFAAPLTRAGGPVAPATTSDGWSRNPAALPEGARVQLDPSLDLDSLELAPWQRTIAQALQRYGMILSDTGGALALSGAGEAGFAADPWQALGVPDTAYPRLPLELVEHLRVLRLPPQHASRRRAAAAPACGALR